MKYARILSSFSNANAWIFRDVGVYYITLTSELTLEISSKSIQFLLTLKTLRKKGGNLSRHESLFLDAIFLKSMLVPVPL